MTQKKAQGTVQRLLNSSKKTDDATRQTDPTLKKFRVSVNDNEYEEIMSYQKIIDFLEADDDCDPIWHLRRRDDIAKLPIDAPSRTAGTGRSRMCLPSQVSGRQDTNQDWCTGP
jgi:hypothetical protein